MVAESLTSPRPPEPYDGSGCACGTINDNLPRVRAQSHFEQSTNNRKTTRGKRAGRWRAVVWPHLHIDDGSMGGGGPITHDNNDFSSVAERRDYYDNYFLNGQGINHPRHGIFRYCIFGHARNDHIKIIAHKEFNREDWNLYGNYTFGTLSLPLTNNANYQYIFLQSSYSDNISLNFYCYNKIIQSKGSENLEYGINNYNLEKGWQNLDLLIDHTVSD